MDDIVTKGVQRKMKNLKIIIVLVIMSLLFTGCSGGKYDGTYKMVAMNHQDSGITLKGDDLKDTNITLVINNNKYKLTIEIPDQSVVREGKLNGNPPIENGSVLYKLDDYG